MKVEELLKPRYKVIADYPLSSMYFNIGDVLTWDDKNQSYRIGDPQFVAMAKETVEKYPHLFKKLEWWENRDEGDMPQYLIFNDERTSILSIGEDVEPNIHEVKIHFSTGIDGSFRYRDYKCFVSEWREHSYSYSHFLPATIEEYEQFTASPQTK